MGGPAWKPEEEALLAQLIEAGNSYATVAQEMARSYNSFRQKCRSLGINSTAEGNPAKDRVDAPPVVPVFDEYLKLDGDWLIVADVYCPCTDWVMASRAALVDAEKLAYAGLDDTTKPVMKRGFMMLRGGYPYLFADGLTDWEFWLDE